MQNIYVCIYVCTYTPIHVHNIHTIKQWRSQPKPDARAPLIPHATNLNVEPTFMKAHAKMPNLFGHAYVHAIFLKNLCKHGYTYTYYYLNNCCLLQLIHTKLYPNNYSNSRAASSPAKKSSRNSSAARRHNHLNIAWSAKHSAHSRLYYFLSNHNLELCKCLIMLNIKNDH